MGRSRTHEDRIYGKGNTQRKERLATRQKTRRELFGDTDNDRLAVTQHLHLGGARHYYLRHDIEIVIETLTVDRSDNIAVHEAYVMAQLAEAITVLNVRSCDIALAVVIAHGYVYDQRKYEIHHHATHHYQEPLPRRLATELPRLGFLFHLLGIHRLVYHAGYLDITAERHPSYAVDRLAYLLLEQREIGIEKEVELLHPRTEYLGEHEVSQLVHHHQYRQAQNQLRDLD